MRINELPLASNHEAYRQAVAGQNGDCLIPNCPGRPAALVMTTMDSGQTAQIALCASHRDPTGELVGLIETVLSLKQTFKERHPQSTTRSFPDRHAYLQAMVDRLNRPSKHLYIIYAGPIPFHPDWYHDIRDGKTHQPNMDRIVARLMGDESCVVRLLIGNFARYQAKVEELVDPALRTALIDGTMARVDEVWVADDPRLRVCCLDTTLYDLPTIFDDCVIRAGRRHPLQAISDGVMTTDANLVTWEKVAFERLFDGAYRGIDEERDVLARLLRS